MSDAEGITAFRTTIQWKGFQLTNSHGSSKKTTYRCSYYRRGCKVKLDVMTDGRVQEIRFPHTCDGTIIVIASDDKEGDTLARRHIRDVSREMAEATDALPVQQVSLLPSNIWEQIRNQFTFDAMTRGLTREQVIGRMYRTRRLHFGGSIHGQVEVPPLSQAHDGANFFQFNFTYASSGRSERVLGWGHPGLIRLLTYADVSLFIDGTFHCVPSEFYHCLIIIVFDRASKCYVPCLWILSTNKSEWSYWHALHCLKVSTGMNTEPGTVTCDFEQALINAVGDQFNEATVVGCLFHFKQAVRRRMTKLHIPTGEISVAMRPGMLDVLTILPHEQIDPQGIDYVSSRIKEALHEEDCDYSDSKWIDFWLYFRRTWIETYPPELWNVRGINLQPVNRTNNPLERYNRELNNEFPTRHPSVHTFVSAIERHAQHYVNLLEDIARGRAGHPPHGTYFTPPEFTLYL